MFQPKLRSALASTVLASALMVLPAQAPGQDSRQPRERKGRPARVGLVPFSPWNLLLQWLYKASGDTGVTIDPEGVNSLPPQRDGSGAQTSGAS
jgi:hypothetical protein